MEMFVPKNGIMIKNPSPQKKYRSWQNKNGPLEYLNLPDLCVKCCAENSLTKKRLYNFGRNFTYLEDPVMDGIVV